MNWPKQFREFGVLNSINPLPPDAQVLWYNLMQSFNSSKWQLKLVVRTQTLENQCSMTRKRLTVARNTLIQRGLIKYHQAKQASGSPSYDLVFLYETQGDENAEPVFLYETHRGTQEETHRGTHNGTQNETLFKTKQNKTKQNNSSNEGGNAPPDEIEFPFWKKFVGIWQLFYKSKFEGNDYLFAQKDWAALKKIYQFLQKRAAQKKYEWTEQVLADGFNFFLNKAFEKDNWSRQNFSLTKILSQFNEIANGQQGSNGNKQSTGSSQQSDLVNDIYAKAARRNQQG